MKKKHCHPSIHLFYTYTRTFHPARGACLQEEGAAIAGAASSATAASAADRSVSEGKGVGVDAQPHLQGSSRSNDGSSEGSSFSTPVHDGDVVGGGQGRGSSGTNVSSTSGLQGQGEACSSSSSSTSGADHAH
eukprot:scaffold223978_cov22-Tisochrysis_lutea.AAC.1